MVKKSKDINKDLFFIYNTSFKHVFFKKRGWVIRFQKDKFIKRLKEYIVNTSHDKREKLNIPINSKKPSLKKRPKVIHVIGKIGGIGGSQKIIFDLLSNLSDKYDMEIITLSNLMLFKYPGIKVKYLNNKDKLKSYIFKFPPDIIHLHYYGDWYGFHDALEVILSLPKNVSIIENVNTPIQMYTHSRIKEYIHVSGEVLSLQKTKKGIVIYPGVDTNEYKPVKKSPQKVAGFVYRLFKDKIDEKSFRILVEVAKRDREIKIIVVGYGDYFKDYFDIVKKAGVRNQFEFMGDIKYKDLAKVYEQFSVFLAAVHTESYGLVVPYAMSMNIPVVAARVGVLPELLGNTNYIAKTDREFIETALKVLQNPNDVVEKSKNGRKRVLQTFSLKKMLNQYDEVYQKVLKNGQSNR